jgi:lysyl-tRNA synthetase class 2
MEPTQLTTPLTDQIEVRKAKQLKIQELQGQLYPTNVEKPASARSILATYSEVSTEALETSHPTCVVSGRIQFVRDFGKGAFWKCKDDTGVIQLFVSKKDLSEPLFELAKCVDLGDWVHVKGVLFRTQKGELTVRIHELRVLAKCLRPLPEKFHGLADIEIRHRQRYLDLMVNEESFETFVTRSRLFTFVRDFFRQKDYLEVETPMLQSKASGALAKPFRTHHNTLDLDLYLRIAPELFLKRLVVGGFPRVFELGRNFRNEGMSTHHNPEFTMLEFYQAYATHQDLMTLMEELMEGVVHHLHGCDSLSYGVHHLRFGKPYPRIHMFEALAQKLKLSVDQLFDKSVMHPLAEQHRVKDEPYYSGAELSVILFEHLFQEQLIQPTYVLGFPVEVSPLARRSETDARFTDRFELYVAGQEIANGFTELNDPEDQLQRFLDQAQAREQGNQEALPVDDDYIEALCYGMPPTAGAGIGMDRLAMLMCNQSSIRDVILFPTQRPA